MADNNKKHIIVCGKGGGTQVQADWNETDNTSPAYINNKPTGLGNEWWGTQAEYDLIDPKDPDTVYHIEGDNNLTYRAFPQGWHTTGTMSQLIADINNDSNAVVGMSYMDTVSFSDLPTGMQQGEIQVDVVSEQTGLGKVLNFTLKSSNLSPYHWEYTSAYGATGTWRGFMPNTTLATVATSGDYTDLINTPSIPAAQVNSDWNANSGVAQILNKPSLATVATTGNYSDLNGTPTIPTNTSDLNNNSGFITINDVPAQVNADWNANSGVAEILNKPSMTTETLTFTLSDQSTVTLTVYVQPTI